MKKTYLLFITVLSLFIPFTFFAGPAFAQVYYGDYQILDSSDISGLSGYTEVTGTLTIGSTSTGATPTTLESLEGLENLTTVGGGLSIENCNYLTSLNGLNNLTTVGGRLYIWSNDDLTDISALSSLTSVGDYLRFAYNMSLTSLNGLENLTSVAGRLEIANNYSLTSLSGLDNLVNIGHLDIRNNTNLTSLSALSNLTGNASDRVWGLWIINNDSLTSLEGLEGLTGVNASLDINWNASLTNLCALYNVNLSGDELTISNNTSLSMDTAYALETQMRYKGFTGIAEIQNNNGIVQVYCDIDGDLIYDDTDNCPYVSNPEQQDADLDNIGDVCDADTIYGTISGDLQAGVEVILNIYSCGLVDLEDTTTNAEGYYAFGGLQNRTYTIYPNNDNYTFDPAYVAIQIPQAVPLSYDFTATLITP